MFQRPSFPSSGGAHENMRSYDENKGPGFAHDPGRWVLFVRRGAGACGRLERSSQERRRTTSGMYAGDQKDDEAAPFGPGGWDGQTEADPETEKMIASMLRNTLGDTTSTNLEMPMGDYVAGRGNDQTYAQNGGVYGSTVRPYFDLASMFQYRPNNLGEAWNPASECQSVDAFYDKNMVSFTEFGKESPVKSQSNRNSIGSDASRASPLSSSSPVSFRGQTSGNSFAYGSTFSDYQNQIAAPEAQYPQSTPRLYGISAPSLSSVRVGQFNAGALTGHPLCQLPGFQAVNPIALSSSPPPSFYGIGAPVARGGPVNRQLFSASNNPRFDAGFEAICTWSGQIPAKDPKSGGSFSRKIFVGGVPWDMSEKMLIAVFGQYGEMRIEWPRKDGRPVAASQMQFSNAKGGFVYVIYESEKSVKKLLDTCYNDESHEWYEVLPGEGSSTAGGRKVQIIPWNIGDSTYIRCPSQRLDPKKTVFVGALHGLVTAELLATIMNDLFGSVVSASVDLDKYKYPIGSGRVIFSNTESYFKALNATFVEIKCKQFSKKIQIDPFLEEKNCGNCYTAPGPLFCRDPMCFRYFCEECWASQHALDVMQNHKALKRNGTRRSSQ